MTPRAKFFTEAHVLSQGASAQLALDGKPMRTPRGHPLAVPTDALAAAIAAEWNALGDTIDPARLPLTRLANTAIDGLQENRVGVIADLKRFAGTDLLCYRCTGPDALAAREAAAWDDLVEWVRDTYGARLRLAAGITHVPQDETTIAALCTALDGLDDFALTALHTVTALTGSLVIALALQAGRLTAAEAFEAAMVDESFQAEQWGVDPEAEARWNRLAGELSDAARFLALLDA